MNRPTDTWQQPLGSAEPAVFAMAPASPSAGWGGVAADGSSYISDFCGVDPAYPALPASAITDTKLRLRYVRVGPEDATLEAIDAMLKRLIKE